MSGSLVTACLWALAATVTALLPMRLQYLPGLTLLFIAPPLLVWIAVSHGPWIGLLGALGFLSMFRRPLIYFGRRALGLPTPDPRRRGGGGVDRGSTL